MPHSFSDKSGRRFEKRNSEQMLPICKAPEAAISEGEKIRPKSLKSKVELVVKEPGDSGIDILVFEDFRQILIMLFQ